MGTHQSKRGKYHSKLILVRIVMILALNIIFMRKLSNVSSQVYKTSLLKPLFASAENFRKLQGQ